MSHDAVGKKPRWVQGVDIATAYWERGRRRVDRLLPEQFFGRLVLASAVVHVAVAVILYAAEPAPYYGWDPSHGLVRTPADAERHPVSSEPLTPIDWDFEVRVHPQVLVRAVEPIATRDLARIAQVYERSAALFPSFVGRAEVPLGPLELRVLPVEVLNDPIYFARDSGTGVVYGLYYPGANVAYITPTALEHHNHLAHEFGHHLFDEYNVLLPNVEEETRTQRFESFVRRFETLLEREHVHVDEPPALRAWAEASHQVISEDGVTVRSLMLVNHERVAWIRKINRAARALLPAYTGREAIIRPLEIRVVKSALLNNPKVFDGATTGRTDGRYFPDRDLLYVTTRAFRGAEVLSHYLAHHYLSGLDLEAESVATLAYGFGFDMDRRLLRTISVVADATTAAAIDGGRVRTLDSALLERIGDVTRAPR